MLTGISGRQRAPPGLRHGRAAHHPHPLPELCVSPHAPMVAMIAAATYTHDTRDLCEPCDAYDSRGM